VNSVQSNPTTARGCIPTPLRI